MTDYFCPECEVLLKRFGSRKQMNFKCPLCNRFFSSDRLDELLEAEV